MQNPWSIKSNRVILGETYKPYTYKSKIDLHLLAKQGFHFRYRQTDRQTDRYRQIALYLYTFGRNNSLKKCNEI